MGQPYSPGIDYLEVGSHLSDRWQTPSPAEEKTDLEDKTDGELEDCACRNHSGYRIARRGARRLQKPCPGTHKNRSEASTGFSKAVKMGETAKSRDEREVKTDRGRAILLPRGMCCSRPRNRRIQKKRGSAQLHRTEVRLKKYVTLGLY